MLETPYTTAVESAYLTIWRTSGASEPGFIDVRTSSAKPRDRSEIGEKISGSFVWLLGSPRYFISLTTPTIVSHGEVEAVPPPLMRLPTGLCPGQKRFTSASLTT